MFCSKCGKENADDAKFCAGCGAAVATESAAGSVRKETVSTKAADEEIRANLKAHKVLSKTDLYCLDCGYKGTMGLVIGKRTVNGWIIEVVLYIWALTVFIVSEFAGGKQIPFLVALFCGAAIAGSYFVRRKLTAYTYSCPNCKNLITKIGL